MQRLLQVREVAQVLGVSEDRAYDLVRRGMLPVVRIGRQVRVEEQRLREWISKGGNA